MLQLDWTTAHSCNYKTHRLECGVCSFSWILTCPSETDCTLSPPGESVYVTHRAYGPAVGNFFYQQCDTAEVCRPIVTIFNQTQRTHCKQVFPCDSCDVCVAFDWKWPLKRHVRNSSLPTMTNIIWRRCGVSDFDACQGFCACGMLIGCTPHYNEGVLFWLTWYQTWRVCHCVSWKQTVIPDCFVVGLL